MRTHVVLAMMTTLILWTGCALDEEPIAEPETPETDLAYAYATRDGCGNNIWYENYSNSCSNTYEGANHYHPCGGAGRAYDVRGTTSYYYAYGGYSGWFSRSDVCNDGSTLIEYFCYGSALASHSTYCPNGCSAGRCL